MEVSNPPAAILEFSRLFKEKVYPELQRLNEHVDKLSKLKADETQKKSNDITDEPEGSREADNNK